MSIMSSLVHHEIHDLPNEAHNTSDKAPAPKAAVMPKSESLKPPAYNESGSTLTPEAKKRFCAMRDKSLRPAMFYTEDVRRPYKNGVWQSSHTVESELEYREETPRG